MTSCSGSSTTSSRSATTPTSPAPSFQTPGTRMKEEAGMGQMYQGIPREDIPWFPLIDPDRCDHCLKCLEFCPHGVYESVEGKLEVANPFNCPVGCSRCQSVCPQKAIP